MKLYTNITPFMKITYDKDEDMFYPAGTTFAAVGVDSMGVILIEQSKLRGGSLKSGHLAFDAGWCSVTLGVIEIAFREVDLSTVKT